MVILGIDPGYATVGYGAIEHIKNKSRVLTYGAITTPPGLAMPMRLSEVYRDIGVLLDKIRPDAVAIEQLFFGNNTTTAIAVAQARGVLLLACAEWGLMPAEYTPLQVKQAVVGYGRAEKRQVMEMTRVQLGLESIPRPDDAADALAIAICHGHSAGSALYKR